MSPHDIPVWHVTKTGKAIYWVTIFRSDIINWFQRRRWNNTMTPRRYIALILELNYREVDVVVDVVKNSCLPSELTYPKTLLKIICPFPRWDMLVPWRVTCPRRLFRSCSPRDLIRSNGIWTPGEEIWKTDRPWPRPGLGLDLVPLPATLVLVKGMPAGQGSWRSYQRKQCTRNRGKSFKFTHHSFAALFNLPRMGEHHVLFVYWWSFFLERFFVTAENLIVLIGCCTIWKMQGM